jgi:diacylglycerol kinase family enzyme
VPGLAVLINRTAYQFARSSDLLAATHGAAGPDALVIETHDLAELDGAVHQVRHDDPDTIAICGGDGSYMAGVTALRRVYGRTPLPRMAFLPGGTVSTVARNYGVRGTPPEALRRVVALHAAGALPTVAHQTIDANGNVGSIFGAGLVASFFDLYYAEAATGYADAARMVARIFAESFVGGAYARRVLEPIRCSVSVDGVPLSRTHFSLICCATVHDLGLHMNVSYRAGERADALHLVASSLPTRALGPQLFRVLRGRRIRGDPHFDGLVRTFRVAFPEKSPWVLDGDLLHARAVDVRLGPVLALVPGVNGGASGAPATSA